jgi:hypothetical protein
MFVFDNDFLLFYGLIIIHSNITSDNTIYIEDLNSSINNWIIEYLKNNDIRFERIDNDTENKIAIYYEDFIPSKKHLIYWVTLSKKSIIHPILYKLTSIEFKYLLVGMILANVNNFDKYTKNIYFYLNHFHISSSRDLCNLFLKYNLRFYNIDFNYLILDSKDIKNFDNNDSIIKRFIE